MNLLAVYALPSGLDVADNSSLLYHAAMHLQACPCACPVLLTASTYIAILSLMTACNSSYSLPHTVVNAFVMKFMDLNFFNAYLSQWCMGSNPCRV